MNHQIPVLQPENGRLKKSLINPYPFLQFLLKYHILNFSTFPLSLKSTLVFDSFFVEVHPHPFICKNRLKTTKKAPRTPFWRMLCGQFPPSSGLCGHQVGRTQFDRSRCEIGLDRPGLVWQGDPGGGRNRRFRCKKTGVGLLFTPELLMTDDICKFGAYRNVGKKVGE